VKPFITLLLLFALATSCQAELRILGEESPPGEYLDENGNPAGVTIDLVNDLLSRLDLTASIEILPWKRAYHMGLNGPEIALMETTRTEKRENLFKWVGPILVVNRIIYARADFPDNVNRLADLQQDWTICVLRASSNESHLQSLGIRQIYPVTKPSQCVAMLLADRVRLFYSSEIGMAGLLAEKKLAPAAFKDVLTLQKEYLYLAFSLDVSDDRIGRWQASLEAAKKDGTVAAIYKDAYPDAMIKEVCLPGDPLTK